jgi:hypothetical protein
MSDPIFPLAVWQQGTLDNSIPANDNWHRLEASRRLVISKVEAEQPASPADGDVYIIPSGATGAQWDEFDPDDIAIFTSGTWYAFGPVDGLVVNVAGTLQQYDGSSGWAAVAGGGAAVWGSIAGTLSDQTDLQDALDAKADTGIPQNSQSSAYTLVLSDANKHILHPSADTTARIFTIPANSSVAFTIGTAVTFVNQNGAGVITISITTDTMRLAGSGTTGSRTLAANGIATALKITATEWIISGTGLT